MTRDIASLRAKKTKRIVGLMSGTSADGIDAALVDITGTGIHTILRLRKFAAYPYPRGFRTLLLKNSENKSSQVGTIALCDMLVASFFSDAVRKLVRTAGVPLSSIDLIGSHGQTIHHIPDERRMFGKRIRATLQIGHPSAIATFTGIPTVGDFRVADMAAGGGGAPLVPLFDYLLMRSSRTDRILLNIGGISNLTFLPRGCAPDDVTAFDTGPGNMVIDALTAKYFNRPYDAGGNIAAAGRLLPHLLRWMRNHPYIARRIPKSTGRELFGSPFLNALIRRGGTAHPRDLVTTATEFTALSIADAIRRFLPPLRTHTELFASGGGIHNRYLMEALSRYLPAFTIGTTASLGIPPDAKEAVCFALLANETIAGHPGNLPQVTGARRAVTLGVLALPHDG
jgi:anhydro-N-acetylmuramic acid kinase